MVATAKSVMNNFSKRGFTLLGAGAYAAVYDSNFDPNLVYKVGSTLNDPFLAYIKLSDKLKDNPHFPNIHSIYEDIENDWYLVKMESLTPVPDHKKSLISTIRKLIQGETISSTKELLDITTSIATMLSSHKEMHLDLHSANVMMRGTTVVITDPVSESNIPTNQDVESWVYKKEYDDDNYRTLRAA